MAEVGQLMQQRFILLFNHLVFLLYGLQVGLHCCDLSKEETVGWRDMTELSSPVIFKSNPNQYTGGNSPVFAVWSCRLQRVDLIHLNLWFLHQAVWHHLHALVLQMINNMRWHYITQAWTQEMTPLLFEFVLV